MAATAQSDYAILNAEAQIVRIGAEQTPVIVLDNVLGDLETLKRVACEWAPFSSEGQAGYPGVRANLPADYGRWVLSRLEPLIREVYKVPEHFRGRCIHQLYSLVTTPESELAVLQRVPHYDTRRGFYFAIMHYLNPGPFGGTGFFRHRPTGYERITDERFEHFVGEAERHMREHGAPPARYCQGSDAHFEMIHEVDYRPDRLLIYPGSLFHSGLIQADRDLSTDPAVGRLTANLFLDFDAP
ncbi:DUF6445 family protein [Marinimicrobium sp. C2-29]|uniref:DUF6445 family protein n=1 Tax=Marinimicrobium sp. C2-29 TaxID=3139825 RepID=UPI0031396A1A